MWARRKEVRSAIAERNSAPLDIHPIEQRKATLRAVEREIDEADELVCFVRPYPVNVNSDWQMTYVSSRKWR